MNIGALRSNGNEWANRAAGERNLLELVAASPALSHGRSVGVAPLPFSPDVRIVDIPELRRRRRDPSRTSRRHPRNRRWSTRR